MSLHAHAACAPHVTAIANAGVFGAMAWLLTTSVRLTATVPVMASTWDDRGDGAWPYRR